MSSDNSKEKQVAVGERIKLARNNAGLTQSEIAIEAGTTPQSWGKYEDGSVSPRGDMLLPFIKRGYSLNWIFDGQGTMKTELATALVGAGAPHQEESFSMSEMLAATARVLESKTVFRSALASNIRAFDKAVQMEGEMSEVKDDVRQMRDENRAMAGRMERMEQLLISLGATVPGDVDEKKSQAS